MSKGLYTKIIADPVFSYFVKTCIIIYIIIIIIIIIKDEKRENGECKITSLITRTQTRG